ncbi:hypothetical protein C2S52_009977 [Perilla frutescens var. hirtella]|nr:hypothetical protein C2S52_009977 [Perilla frutescens var. hirtella]
MGCVSSTLLNQDEEFPKIGGSAAFSHHIVSLTSTTYGFLTLDTPSSDPPTTSTAAEPPLKHQQQQQQPLETINSWDLMSGLDSDQVPSFRYLTTSNTENVNPNVRESSLNLSSLLEKYEVITPPNGEKRVVLYTTSLRGVRKTFEDCEKVRSAIRGLGIPVSERDVSMDRGFRDELRGLMKGKGGHEAIPPRLFVQGRYVGGVEEVMKIVDEGSIAKLIQGLPKLAGECVCEGCGGVGFLPCFSCHGSCKVVVGVGVKKRSVVVKCGDCNENGLVLCPICS